MSDITPAVRADLAPTGKLRAGINYGNFILATKDRATGESRGVAVDLLNEIGRRLGVPVEIVAYDSVAVMGDAAPTGVWDVSSAELRGQNGLTTSTGWAGLRFGSSAAAASPRPCISGIVRRVAAPGEIVFTVQPSFASSSARTREKPAMPDLAAP